MTENDRSSNNPKEQSSRPDLEPIGDTPEAPRNDTPTSSSGQKQKPEESESDFADDLSKLANQLGSGLSRGIDMLMGEGKKVRQRAEDEDWAGQAKDKTKQALDKASEATRADTIETDDELTVITTGKKPPPPRSAGSMKGRHVDGWSDLIEGRGDKAEAVYEALNKILVERQPPDTRISKVSIKERNFLYSQTRTYAVTTTFPKATTYIYVGQYGTDLYVSWNTYVKTKLRWGLIIFIAIVGAALGFATGIEIHDSINVIFPSFFFDSMILFTVIFMWILLFWLLSWIGTVTAKDPTTLFRRPLKLFDVEDIIAMSMAAHRSLIAALQIVGIEEDVLHLKRSFSSGERI